MQIPKKKWHKKCRRSLELVAANILLILGLIFNKSIYSKLTLWIKDAWTKGRAGTHLVGNSNNNWWISISRHWTLMLCPYLSRTLPCTIIIYFSLTSHTSTSIGKPFWIPAFWLLPKYRGFMICIRNIWLVIKSRWSDIWINWIRTSASQVA